MRRIKITLSPLYLIFAFVVIYFGGFQMFCYYFVAMALHEYSHYFLSKRLGYMFQSLNIMPYGAKLDVKVHYKKRSHEIWIALAGPLANLIIVLLFTALWWINPTSYGYTKEFVEANLYLGIFNLFPIFPLDGGHIILNLFKSEKAQKVVYRCMQILGIVICVILMGLFIYSAFHTLNFSLFFISLFLFVVCATPYKSDYLKCVNKFKNNNNDILEVKKFVVDYKVHFLQLVKYFNDNYYICFSFYNQGKCVKILSQQEICCLIDKGIYTLNIKNLGI